MKKFSSILATGLVLMVLLNSCQVVEGIFKAGMWTMFIIIVLVVALIIWIIRKFSK